jgi:hypothetical protein
MNLIRNITTSLSKRSVNASEKFNKEKREI